MEMKCEMMAMDEPKELVKKSMSRRMEAPKKRS